MFRININDHPTNRKMKVFFYEDPSHAAHFENLLKESNVKYEFQIDEEGDRTIYFGVSTADFEKVKKLNYLTLGQFRKPFIPDRAFRIILIVISMTILLTAIVGAIVSS